MTAVSWTWTLQQVAPICVSGSGFPKAATERASIRVRVSAPFHKQAVNKRGAGLKKDGRLDSAKLPASKRPGGNLLATHGRATGIDASRQPVLYRGQRSAMGMRTLLVPVRYRVEIIGPCVCVSVFDGDSE